MGRIHVDPFFGLGVGPPIADAPAGKHQRVRAPLIDHSQFQILPKWRVRNRLPHLKSVRGKPRNPLISIKLKAKRGAKQAFGAKRWIFHFPIDFAQNSTVRTGLDGTMYRQRAVRGNSMDAGMKRVMKSVVIKRSIILDGHKTSVSLENEFWAGLREIADFKKTTVSALVGQLDRERDNCNLSSAIRVYVFNHFRLRDRH